MKKKRIRIGTALKRAYSKTKKRVTKNAKKSATIHAIKNTSIRMKNRLITFINKTRKSVKRVTSKADRTFAKKIRSIVKRRH